MSDEIAYYKKINNANLLFNKFYGKYGLEQLIGMGSFGQVYKAIDFSKQRKVKERIHEQKTLSKSLQNKIKTDQKHCAKLKKKWRGYMTKW